MKAQNNGIARWLTAVPEAIQRQAALVQHGEYEPLGRLLRLSFENGAALEWPQTGPLLGRSLDGGQVLVCSALPPPPPVPDPHWTPPPNYDARGFLIREKPPLVEQKFPQPVDGFSAFNEHWAVLPPVKQMVLRPSQGAGFTYVLWGPDQHGRRPWLIYCPAWQQGHVLWGVVAVRQVLTATKAFADGLFSKAKAFHGAFVGGSVMA